MTVFSSIPVAGEGNNTLFMLYHIGSTFFFTGGLNGSLLYYPGG
jgi:hypothetical protein